MVVFSRFFPATKKVRRKGSSPLRTCSRAVSRPPGTHVRSSTWSTRRFGGGASGTRSGSGTAGAWSLKRGPARARSSGSPRGQLGRGSDESAAVAVLGLLSLRVRRNAWRPVDPEVDPRPLLASPFST